MGKIQFGLVIPTGARDKSQRGSFMADVRKSLDYATGHFDSAWVVDHLQLGNSDLLEGWTTLSYFSALYPQFQFGNAVLSQSFRNPGLLGKMTSTLQYLSNGRFILGIGTGWHEYEYKAYNYPFPSAGTRVEELEETIQILHTLWKDEKANFQGKHYRITDAWCEPKPEPLPKMMIGGSMPKMLRLVAKYADWWNVSWTSIGDFRSQVVECEKACAEVGRDPQTLRRTWFGGCLAAPNDEALAKINVRNLKAGNAFVGTPAQLIEQMQPFVELGVDYFMLSNTGFPDQTTLHMLVEEVMPALEKAKRR